MKPVIKNLILNESLSRHTTFKIGGPAKYFCMVKSAEEIINAMSFAKKKKIPIFVLGGGSNILFSDRGFSGLVIKITGKKVFFNKNKVEADAGVPLAYLVSESIKKRLSGLEYMAGIPGTLGGAVFGNAGLGKNGPWIGDFVESAKLLMPNGEIKNIKKHWFKFVYRHSRLKEFKRMGCPIVLSVVLKLKKGDRQKLEKIIKEKMNTRKDKYPNEPSSGCIFKNPDIAPAAKFIEECGLKGKKIGGAQVSKKHANFIVNINNATARDVRMLINLIKKEVKKKIKINLEEEIQIV